MDGMQPYDTPLERTGCKLTIKGGLKRIRSCLGELCLFFIMYASFSIFDVEGNFYLCGYLFSASQMNSFYTLIHSEHAKRLSNHTKLNINQQIYLVMRFCLFFLPGGRPLFVRVDVPLERDSAVAIDFLRFLNHLLLLCAWLGECHN